MSTTSDYSRDPKTGALILRQTSQVKQRLAERERAKTERTLDQRLRKVEAEQAKTIQLLERVVALLQETNPKL